MMSQIDQRMYVGMSRNPEKRVGSHNNGDTKSTKGYIPWMLLTKKYIGCRRDAREEEKRWKTGHVKEQLKSKYSPVAQR